MRRVTASSAFGVGQPSPSASDRLSTRKALQIVANRAGAAVALGNVWRQQLGDDRLQAGGASAVERRWKLASADALLEASRIRGPERLNAADHFVEQDADCPEFGLGVDLSRLETLGREIRDAAEVVARDFSAER